MSRLLNRNSNGHRELMAMGAPLPACIIDMCIGSDTQMVVPTASDRRITEVQLCVRRWTRGT